GGGARAKEAASAWRDLSAAGGRGPRGRNAAPHHLPAVDGWRRIEGKPTHGRVDAVGADDEVVRAGTAVAELDGYTPVVSAQCRDRRAETAGPGAGQQRSVKLGALDADERA